MGVHIRQKSFVGSKAPTDYLYSPPLRGDFPYLPGGVVLKKQNILVITINLQEILHKIISIVSNARLVAGVFGKNCPAIYSDSHSFAYYLLLTTRFTFSPKV